MTEGIRKETGTVRKRVGLIARRTKDGFEEAKPIEATMSAAEAAEAEGWIIEQAVRVFAPLYEARLRYEALTGASATIPEDLEAL